ncbi:hypothetical protein NQZ79_g263 [Umbelopsis isabellina]|nr:hypothetical protein NQZ79_g263 [Umbelopsis isabellina]
MSSQDSRSRSPRRSYRSYSPDRQSRYRRDRSRSRSPYDDRRQRRGGDRIPNEDKFEYRRRMREEGTATFWVASPELRPRTPSPDSDHGRKSKRSRRSDRYSDESGDDSDTDKHRRRKHKKSSSSKKKKSSKHKKSSSSRRSHRRSPTPITDSESEDDRRRSVEPVSNGKDAQAQVLEVDETQLDAVPDLWVEKQVEIDDESAPVGPLPLPAHDDHLKESAYGGSLLPGEGSAMAAYVQEGKRIPRRGEIGLNSDQIESFESAGFVMSGSRHQRMNAVRMRKENQVISAEEKRQLLSHASEQKLKRENEIISGFREILNEKQKK